MGIYKEPFFIHPPALEKSKYLSVTLILYALIVATAAFVAFSPTLTYDFTNWDDAEYVAKNPDAAGFSCGHMFKAFSKFYLGNYQPLTMISYMADFSVAGLNSAAYHRTNVLLHCVNAVLVFFLLAALTGNPLAALMAALLFAVHPLRVESVAWVAERKDVLSALFYFLSLLAYVRYVCKNEWGYLAYSGIAMALSLLAKPMAITIPAVMLLFDYLLKRKIKVRVIVEKIPVAVFSAVFAGITFFAQQGSGALQEFPKLSIMERLCVPFYGIAFYVLKTVVPSNLCAFYYLPPHPDAQMKALLFVAPMFTIATATVLYVNRWNRALLFGVLFYLVSLLPVLQIIPAGGAIVADRYTYIPVVGICFLAAAGISWLSRKRFMNPMLFKGVLYSGVFALAVLYGVSASKRDAVWENNFSLWNDVLAKHPNPSAYNNRGTAYNSIGRYDLSISDFTQAVLMKPDYALAYSNRGGALFFRGKIRDVPADIDAAIADFTRAIAIKPKFAQAWMNRGNVFMAQQMFGAALDDYDTAIALSPHSSEMYYNRGILLREIQHFNAAFADFNEAIRLNPASAASYYERGITYGNIGKYDEAIADFRQCLLLAPSYPNAQKNLNNTLILKERMAQSK